MHRCVWQLLLLAAAHLCSQTISSSTASKTGLTLQQRLETIAKYKRSINGRRELITSTTSIYSQTSMEIAENLYDSLYRKIIHDRESVDIVILLDGSDSMGATNFATAQKFLAKLIRMMPAEKFRDGSIKVSMLSYALSEDITRHFDFSWDKGIYREMVRRAIRRATFPSGYENHGSSALNWVYSVFRNSSRFNNSDTAKVILYATNGFITDKDLYEDYDDATFELARWLKANGFTMFTIVPGTRVERYTISTLAYEPNANYIIPVVNSHAAESIAVHIKDHKRGAHHHNTS